MDFVSYKIQNWKVTEFNRKHLSGLVGLNGLYMDYMKYASLNQYRLWC